MEHPTTLTLEGAISMCIYCNTKNYRKIYELHHGPIPKDPTGRTYEIHHIDGSHINNHPTNLIAITIQEHYDIHYAQGDYGACFKMANRMKLSSEEISKLSKETQDKRVKSGTHHLLGGKIQSNYWQKRSTDGTHHMSQENNPAIQRVNNGTHNLLGPNTNRKRIENGTHNWIGGEQQRKQGKQQVAEGRHHWLGGGPAQKLMAEGRHASQLKYTCKHCGISCCPGNHAKYHGDKCKKKFV
jgi:hypothetical protein